jgi:hypothetical protein
MQLGPSRTAMIVVQPRCGVRSAALTTSPQAVMPAYLLSSTGSSQAMVHVMAPLDTVTPEGIKYTFTLRSSALEFTPGLLLVLPQETLFPRDILLHQCHRMLRLPSIAACCMEFGTLEVGSMQDEQGLDNARLLRDVSSGSQAENATANGCCPVYTA